ncbi:AT-rich interactive domain-containing protein 2-like isoform X2 [Rutidosis leptorrhynchoides]|uniref:AT-rich interactive domain-containing protein 2-like isoform X2 n=1 Tax=Rutidosis leptorrhynchoides TaxID=125765 RepID=UPI003A99D965
MAHDSGLKNGSNLNEFKVHEDCSSDELFVNHDSYVKYGDLNGCMDVNELRALFDQVLSFFLKEVSVNRNLFRPFPPKLGDGHHADLFKLFLTVRRIGSYELVSETNLWEFVARECGLEIELVASLKLIYIKYLEELDQWLFNGGFKDEEMENLNIGLVEKLDLLSRQLGKSIIDVEVVEFEDATKKNEGTSGFDRNTIGMNLEFSRINDDDDDEKFSLVDDKTCDLSPEVIKKVGFSMVNDEVKRNELSSNNVVKKMGLPRIADNDCVMLTANNDARRNVISYNVDSQKRKMKEEPLSISEMLDWLTHTARNPHDPAVKMSQSNMWNNDMTDKLRKQVLIARRVLFAELNVDSVNEACGSQKNQKMHPSMYEDDTVQSNCSRRSGSAIPSPSRIKRQRIESGKIPMDRISELVEPHGEKYNVGPLYQAQVPPWTGIISESDPKWLGTQMWPPPNDINGEYKKDISKIGLGRETFCECVFPGSAECVRFHIAENRLKVKIKLGQLFYEWKFNRMGEEVSLSWEPEEEKRFKNLAIRARYELGHSTKSRREIMNNFWKKASNFIPAKSKQNVVSYYFNVFVIRRRSYQNRVTPNEIDSDNDEEEVGSVGDRFGYEKVHGLLLKCSENLQRTDL